MRRALPVAATGLALLVAVLSALVWISQDDRSAAGTEGREAAVGPGAETDSEAGLRAPASTAAVGRLEPSTDQELAREGLAEQPPKQAAGEPGMATTGTLVVEVRDGETKVGLPGEVVCVQSDGTLRAAIHEAATDETGICRFAGIAAGDWSVRGATFALTSVRIEPGAISVLEVETRGHDDGWEGRVVDQNQQAVASAQIWLSQFEGRAPRLASTLTDAQGRFSVPRVGVARWFGVRAAGYEPSPAFEISKGPWTHVELVWTGASLEGRVVDLAGEPVEHAAVSLFPDVPPGPGSRFEPQRTHADAQGRFRFEAVHVGPNVLLVAAIGFAARSESVLIERERDVTREVVLEPGCAVSGVVTDASGNPCEGVSVVGGAPDSAGAVWSRTDRNGAYELRGVAGGAVPLSARKSGLGEVSSVQFCQPPGRIEWSPVLGVPGDILATVVDDRGAPVADVLVVLLGGAELRAERTDARGVVQFFGLPHGSYRLEARDAGNLVLGSQAGVRPGGESLRITVLARGSSVLGRAVDAQGHPVEDATVVFSRLEGSATAPAARTSRDGSFESALLPAGTYRVLIDHSSSVLRILDEVRIESGERVDLGAVVLRPARTLRVQLADARSGPLELALSDLDGALVRRWTGTLGEPGEVVELERVPCDALVLELRSGTAQREPLDSVPVPAGSDDALLVVSADS